LCSVLGIGLLPVLTPYRETGQAGL
jgi:hypothetical protein